LSRAALGDSRPPEINSSAIRVAGIGGLGMVAMAIVIAIAIQPARWLLVGRIVGGAGVALVLILARRRLMRRELPGTQLPRP
jgi:hypothetical protein